MLFLGLTNRIVGPTDPTLFKPKATSDVLLFLINHRFSDFSLRELATQTEHSHQSVRRAVNVLSTNDLVVQSHESNQRLVQINRERLSIPDNPILRIPQIEYHQPVKAAVTFFCNFMRTSREREVNDG